ncbi:hypothetical protein AV903_08525 [Erwinia tracheiphila]|uniref:Hemolysin XhlA n=2 Tax=Erwinia tracheiphila TaxID=65700 RepID=A0A345CZ80_9GAMM|nr:hypothetical protein AV903_08525 [Erwinia tracheiphila]
MERNSATVHQLFDPNGPAYPNSDRHKIENQASLFYGNGNGGGGDMLERVKKLEEQVASIGTDIAVIKATICTKEDLQKELNSQTWKIILALVVTILIAVLSKYFIK